MQVVLPVAPAHNFLVRVIIDDLSSQTDARSCGLRRQREFDMSHMTSRPAFLPKPTSFRSHILQSRVERVFTAMANSHVAKVIVLLLAMAAVSQAFSPASLPLMGRSASSKAFSTPMAYGNSLRSRISAARAPARGATITSPRMAVSLPADKPLKVGICGELVFLPPHLQLRNCSAA